MSAGSHSKNKSVAANEQKSSSSSSLSWSCCSFLLVSAALLVLCAVAAGAYVFINYDVHSVSDVIGKIQPHCYTAIGCESLLVRPEAIACGADLCFSPDVLFFSEREISEMRGPTSVKFCTMVSNRSKICKIWPDFGRLRSSPKRMNIFKIGFLFRLPRFLLR